MKKFDWLQNGIKCYSAHTINGEIIVNKWRVIGNFQTYRDESQKKVLSLVDMTGYDLPHLGRKHYPTTWWDLNDLDRLIAPTKQEAIAKFKEVCEKENLCIHFTTSTKKEKGKRKSASTSETQLSA